MYGCTEEPVDRCMCPEIYQPVCGEDGVTYPNDCFAGCANVSVAHEGECIVEDCVDSDGGKIAGVKGTASAAGLSYTDYCEVFDAVEEYYCEGDIIGIERVLCEEGFGCEGGACVEIRPEPAGDCEDSDGKDSKVKGIVNASGVVYHDSCQDPKHVLEHYCLDGEAREEMIECASGFGCEDGRCEKTGQTCEDSDGGYNIGQGGTLMLTINLVSGEYLDKCLSGDRLKEYYCDGNEAVFEEVECPGESRCVQAACKEDVCTDTDEASSIYRKGTVNKGDVLLRDYCVDDHSGVEYYCEDNDISNVTFSCPTDERCIDGRCEE